MPAARFPAGGREMRPSARKPQHACEPVPAVAPAAPVRCRKESSGASLHERERQGPRRDARRAARRGGPERQSADGRGSVRELAGSHAARTRPPGCDNPQPLHLVQLQELGRPDPGFLGCERRLRRQRRQAQKIDRSESFPGRQKPAAAAAAATTSSESACELSPGPRGPAGASGSAGADRKSTRLNSSHSQISYAVFCLKKKKTREHTLRLHTKANICVRPPAQTLVLDV